MTLDERPEDETTHQDHTHSRFDWWKERRGVGGLTAKGEHGKGIDEAPNETSDGEGMQLDHGVVVRAMGQHCHAPQKVLNEAPTQTARPDEVHGQRWQLRR
jgi:hypothetical protein